MTDSDIIKALECCYRDSSCEGCQYGRWRNKEGRCIEKMQTDTIALIKRQQAEIERLKTENAELEAEAEKQYEQARADILGNMADGGASCHWCIAEHKKNAVREFAERLKARAYTAKNEWSHGEHPLVVEVDDIDELVAEMEGEDGK